MKIVDGFVKVFKKRLYGKTFFCPVCHLELSYHDADENDCLVCPLCGVVIELHETYGHSLPIVNDVEINRVQPKARLHPMATHLPVGLFPLALLGGVVLLIISVYLKLSGLSLAGCSFCSTAFPWVDNATLIMLFIAVVTSALTFLTGFFDWKRRYGGRPYRVITLKILLSGLFFLIGIIVIALHAGLFQAGILQLDNALSVLAAILYYLLMGFGMFVISTLGHVGGYLVFGR